MTPSVPFGKRWIISMIKLLKLEKSDLEKFTEIAIESFTDDKQNYGEYPPLIDIEHRSLRYIDDGYTYKIIYNNEMIGGMIVFSGKADGYTLGSIFLKPSYQNQGIGQRVIQLMEEKFSDAKTWFLDTPYLSFRNHHFYEKMGYVKMGEKQPEKDKEFKIFFYEKRIKHQ